MQGFSRERNTLSERKAVQYKTKMKPKILMTHADYTDI